MLRIGRVRRIDTAKLGWIVIGWALQIRGGHCKVGALGDRKGWRGGRGRLLGRAGLRKSVTLMQLGAVGGVSLPMSDAEVLSNKVSVAVGVVTSIDGLWGVFRQLRQVDTRILRKTHGSTDGDTSARRENNSCRNLHVCTRISCPDWA